MDLESEERTPSELSFQDINCKILDRNGGFPSLLDSLDFRKNQYDWGPAQFRRSTNFKTDVKRVVSNTPPRNIFTIDSRVFYWKIRLLIVLILGGLFGKTIFKKKNTLTACTKIKNILINFPP